MAGEEQTNTDNDPGVEENEEVESTQTESANEQQAADSHESRNQWILFGILAIYLLIKAPK